jgi:iron complex outermembrane receptor protein
VVDLRLGGEYQNFFWSIAVQNLFNVQYFEYAVASTFTLGRYSAYPLPGRVVMLKGGMKF